MTKKVFILNFFKIYNILWQAALPFLKKNQRLSSSFTQRTTCNHLEKADIWIQAASAGEAFLALSLVSCLKPAQKTRVLITATTSQGMEILESGLSREPMNPHVEYCLKWFPFDSPSIVQEAVRRINPRIMVLLETELWPALLYYLKENKTRIFIVNARLSPGSARHYQLTKFLWSRLAPDLILAISPADAKRYARVFEHTPIHTMPNIKFDLMAAFSDIPCLPETLISPHLPLSILASVRKQEEAQALKILKYLLAGHPLQVVAVFPRHMHRLGTWKKKLAHQGFSFQLRSDLTGPVTAPCIILWDTFGELRSAYGLARTVFVGGSLKPLGGQNFIEPAVLGAPTVTGPHLSDFAWVGEEIFFQKIVARCHDWQEVAQTMVTHLHTSGDRSPGGQQARDYIQQRQGGSLLACQRIIEALEPGVPMAKEPSIPPKPLTLP